jgi:hypothetical protein
VNPLMGVSELRACVEGNENKRRSSAGKTSELRSAGLRLCCVRGGSGGGGDGTSRLEAAPGTKGTAAYIGTREGRLVGLERACAENIEEASVVSKTGQ